LVGVPKYKLRHWCDRYLPEIQKIDIGDMQHRRFTDRDIELIKRSRRIGTGVSHLRRPLVRPLEEASIGGYLKLGL
jgi:DNA-binding transcriptional MerR regulator